MQVLWCTGLRKDPHLQLLHERQDWRLTLVGVVPVVKALMTKLSAKPPTGCQREYQHKWGRPSRNEKARITHVRKSSRASPQFLVESLLKTAYRWLFYFWRRWNYMPETSQALEQDNRWEYSLVLGPTARFDSPSTLTLMVPLMPVMLALPLPVLLKSSLLTLEVSPKWADPNLRA